MGGVPHPTPPPALGQSGSAIDAASSELQQKNAVMAGAVNALGGGKRSRRRGHKKRRGGADVKVGGIPNFVSAGGVDTKQMFAGLLKAQDTANANAAYDKLGDAPPMQITHEGGRRRIKKSRRHNGKRSKSVRKHTRSRRMSRRVRRSVV